jgi:hypothetical protein
LLPKAEDQISQEPPDHMLASIIEIEMSSGRLTLKRPPCGALTLSGWPGVMLRKQVLSARVSCQTLHVRDR